MRKKKRKPTKPLDQYVAHNRFVRDAADEACFPIFRGTSCFVCGDGYETVGHHIIRRSASRHFRHHICNIVPLCKKCHCAVESRSERQIELLETIRKHDGRWYAYILWAIRESRRRGNEHLKPDYHAARLFWQAHEDSGRTLGEALRAFLDAWNLPDDGRTSTTGEK